MAPPIPGLSRPVAPRRRSTGDIVAGVLAVAALAVLIVGVPVALITVLGLPIPHSKPTVGLLTHQLSILSLIQILSVIVWLAWLQLVCCVAVEVRAAIRNVGVPTRIPLSGGTQAMAHRLVTAALLLFTATATLSPAMTGSGYARPAHTVSAEHQPGAPGGLIKAMLTSQETAGPHAAESVGADAASGAVADQDMAAAAKAPQGEKIYIVRPPRGRFHESLWEIAENHLGNGLRYREIFEMNKDRPQPDGTRLTMAALIRPGWILRMPRDAYGPGIRIVTPGTPGGPASAAEQAGASQAERATAAATGNGAPASGGQSGTASPSPSSPSPSSPSPTSSSPTSPSPTSPSPTSPSPTSPSPTASSPGPSSSSSGPSAAESAAASQAERATPAPTTPVPSPRASTQRPSSPPSTSSQAPGTQRSTPPASSSPARPSTPASSGPASSTSPVVGAGSPNAAERAGANQAKQATPAPTPKTSTPAPHPRPSTSSPASSAPGSPSPAASHPAHSAAPAGPPPMAAGSPDAAERAAASQAEQATNGQTPHAASVPGAQTGPVPGSRANKSPAAGDSVSGPGSPDAAEHAAAGQAQRAGQAATGAPTPTSGPGTLAPSSPSVAPGAPAAGAPQPPTSQPPSAPATGGQPGGPVPGNGPMVPVVPGAPNMSAAIRPAPAAPPVFPHELAASSLLAAGLLAAVGRRKREQLWQRAYGSTVVRPEGPAAMAESALRLGANPSAVRVLDIGLRSLSQELAARGKTPPTVFAAHIGQVNLDLWIAAADLNPPRPWQPVDDGQVWRLPLSAAAALDTGDAGAALAPYPGLVSIGTSDTGRMLVDLEVACGLIAVRGSLNQVQAVLAAIAVELATNRWSDRMRITLVGFAPGLAALAPGRITVAATLDEAMPALEARAAELSRAIAAQQDDSGPEGQGQDGSVLAGRSRDMQPDAWAPHYLISAIPPTPQQQDRLLTLASTRHRTAMGYVVAGDVPGAAWSWDVTEQGRLRADVFGFDLRAQMLPPQQCAAVVDLFCTAARPGGAPLPVPPPDAVPAGQLVPGSQMSVEVSLLGQVAVQAPGGIEPARIGAATEIVAFLAAHPEGVHPDVLNRAIWPRGVAPEVQNAALARVRDWLGADPAGQPNLISDQAGRLRLGPHVRVDWQVFRSLVGHAVQARQAAGQYPSARQDEAAFLARALDLIHGQLLDGHDPRSYAWLAADPLEYHATAQVADVAHRLCELCLATGDSRGAMDAARSGLRFAFYDEMLWRDLLTAAHATGEEHVLRGVVGELSARVSLDEVLPRMAPQTEALIDELLPSWRSSVG
jgi:hypothetical protein